MDSTVPFDRLDHMHRVPVRVGDDVHPFLIDTGIGVNVVSPDFAARSDVSPLGTSYVGRRMSGQRVEVPLTRLPELRVGDFPVTDRVAGVLDLGEGFAGILGLGSFEGHTLMIDPGREVVAVRRESPTSPDDAEVPLEVRRDGPAVDTFTELVLPSGRTIRVEVDTGTANLVLHTRYMTDCGLTTDDPSVETATGTDETGYEWTRHRATIAGSVHLAAAPQTAHERPRVQFQDIIYDGLVGTDYLDRFRMTVDLTGARLTLRPRRGSPAKA